MEVPVLGSLPRLPGWTITQASDADRSDLAGFCIANPDYDILLTGEVPEPAAWVEDFLTDLPPADFHPGPTAKLVVRPAEGGDIAAILDVTLGMIDPHVAHIGLFQVAQARHGSGLAHQLYPALESWLAGQGMEAVRLGVLITNPRAAAFWTRHGYQPLRHRTATLDHGRTVVTEVRMKLLAPITRAAYLARVPRDDPSAP